MNQDKFARAAGFDNWLDMITLVATVDISTGEKLDRFFSWKESDGSKAGLLLLRQQNNASRLTSGCSRPNVEDQLPQGAATAEDEGGG